MNSEIATVCLILLTLAAWVGLGFFIVTALQLWRTAQALEILTYKISDSVHQLHDASVLLNDFAGKVRSGWMRALEMALAAATSFWKDRRPQETEETARVVRDSRN